MAFNKINKKNLTLFLILLIAAFFRFWNIAETPPGLYPDEAMNGNNALEAIYKNDFKMFYPENNGREGLFINIQAISILIFGNKPWALRIVSGIFGVLTVLGIYFFAKELFKNKNLSNLRIAIYSSFFVAASFWHINFSRVGFRAIMAPFFITWSLYLLLKAFNKFNGKYGFWFLMSGFVYGLGFHSYIAYRATPIIIAFIFLYFLINKIGERKKVIFASVLFFTGAFISTAPLLIYFYQNPADFFGRTSQISVFGGGSPFKDLFFNTIKTLGMFWYRGDYNWRHNFAGEPELVLPVGVLFALGIIICIFRICNFGFGILKNKNIFPEILLLFSFVIGLLPVVISNEGIPHALRSIILIPFVMVISGYGLEIIYSNIQEWLTAAKNKFKELERKITRIEKETFLLVVILFVYVSAYTFTLYFLRFAIRPEVRGSFSENYVLIGNYLNSLPQDLKKYVIVNANGTDVRGLPMSAQTTMFITRTFLPEWQKEKNIYYIMPQNLNEILCENSCVVAMLETDSALRREVKEKINGLSTITEGNVIVLKK